MATIDIEDYLKANEARLTSHDVIKPDPNPHLPHLPVIFMLDISDSMNESPAGVDEIGKRHKIDELNDAVSGFFSRIQNAGNDGLYGDLKAQGDFCIVTYNSEARVAMPWMHGSKLGPITRFEADGTTNLGAAIVMVGNLLRDQYLQYRHNQTPACCGFVFNLTDGKPDMREDDDTWKLAQSVMELWEQMGSRKNPYAQFAHFGVEGADFDLLRRLSKRESRVMKLEANKMDELIKFAQVSLQAGLLGGTLDDAIRTVSEQQK